MASAGQPVLLALVLWRQACSICSSRANLPEGLVCTWYTVLMDDDGGEIEPPIRELRTIGSSGRRRKGEDIAPSPPRPEPDILAELQQMLDALDDAMLAGHDTKVDVLTRQLWRYRRQVPAALVTRLRTGRAQLPMLAFQLLADFAGSRTPTHLKRIAADLNVPDIVRWGARRRAGWSERGEAKARMKFLNSLQDADETLVEALDQASSWWPPEVGILHEVLAYVEIVPSARKLEIVQRAVAREVPELTWFLRSLLHVADSTVQHVCVEFLLRMGDHMAVGALDRLGQTTQDDALRQEASAAARRLQMRVVTSDDAQDTAASQRPWPEIDRILISEIDGDGGQLLMLTRRWTDEMRLLLTIFWKDHWGIKDAWGVFHQPADDLQEHFSTPPGEMTTMVPIDLPAARGILAAAMQATVAHQHAVPAALELWEPFLHDGFPAAVGEAVDAVELDDAPYGAQRDLVRRSATLLDHPTFAYWFFNPDEIGPLLIQQELSDQPQRSGPAIDLMIRQLVDSHLRDLLRWRLRRQAWLLARLGDSSTVDMALAVSASLANASPAALGKHPFLRAMVNRSLRNMFGAFALDGPL